MVLFTLVMLYPTVQAFLISLQQYSLIRGVPSTFVGLANYGRALHDPTFWRSLANSAVYLVATVPVQIVGGLVLATALNGRFRGRVVFRLLLFVPVVISWVVVSLLFRYLFETDSGFVNFLVTDVTGLTQERIDWFGDRWTAMAAISVLGIWKGVGWTMIIFLAALQSVPAELKEAAAVDGAGRWQAFRAVSLPAIRRTLTFVTIMLVIGAFNVFISVQLMTDGGPADKTQVPLTYLYREAFNFLDFGYGSAIAFLLTVIVFGFSVGQYWFGRRDEREGAR